MALERGHPGPFPDPALQRPPPHGGPSAHPDLLHRPAQQQQQQQRGPWERDAGEAPAWGGRPPGPAGRDPVERGYGRPEQAERGRHEAYLAEGEEERRRAAAEFEDRVRRGAPPHGAPPPWPGGEPDRWGPPPAHAARPLAAGVHVRPLLAGHERRPAPAAPPDHAAIGPACSCGPPSPARHQPVTGPSAR